MVKYHDDYCVSADDNSWWIEALWLIDTSEEGNHKKISENPDEFRVSPDNKNIAFIEHDDTAISVKSSDNAGNVAILFETSLVPLLGGEISSVNVSNLMWSHDGKKLSFVDFTHGQKDACPSYNPDIKLYIPHLLVMDRLSGSKQIIKIDGARCDYTYECSYCGHPECYQQKVHVLRG